MFPNPQSALPLPPRPDLEHYRKLAKELVRACRSGEHAAEGSVAVTSREIRQWASSWISGLVKHLDLDGDVPKSWTDEVASFAARAMTGPDNCTLAIAQFIVARSHGFPSWPKFADHLRDLAKRDSRISNFEAAVEAIVAGDASKLRRLLKKEPELVRQRSTREHRATLLHYVSANGVEGYRQRTPKNTVEIARILLDAGAEVDAVANVYDGDCTTLGLAATSVHPYRAGVQNELMQLLLDRGAAIHRPKLAGDQASLITACFANGRTDAARYLADHGAPLDIEAAAGLGRMVEVREFFDDQGELKAPTTKHAMQRGFLWACAGGHNDVIEFLLERGVDLTEMADTNEAALHMAVIGGNVSTVKLLMERGAPLEQRNGYRGTPLEQAGYSFMHCDVGTDYLPVFEALLSAGATIQTGWLEWVDNVKSRSPAEKQQLAELLRRFGASD